jgi:hypothetical protein
MTKNKLAQLMHETRIKLALTAKQMASQIEMPIELYNDIENDNLVLPKQEQQKLMHELLEKYEHEG